MVCKLAYFRKKEKGKEMNKVKEAFARATIAETSVRIKRREVRWSNKTKWHIEALKILKRK